MSAVEVSEPFMNRIVTGFLSLLFLLGVPVGIRAQESPAAFVERQKTEAKEEVVRFLKSGTPRDRAWAAHLCAKFELKEFAPQLIAALNPKFGNTGWASPTPLCPDRGRTEVEENRFPEEKIQAIGNQAVLDALIRLGARPTADELRPYAKGHPNETLILLAREPVLNEAALMTFLDGDAAAFAMPVLVKSRSRMLAVKFLRESVTIRVSITAPERKNHSGMPGGVPGGVAGASISTATPCPLVNYPRIRFYKLVSPTLATLYGQKVETEEKLAWITLDFGRSYDEPWRQYQDERNVSPLPCRQLVADLMEDSGAFRDLEDFPRVVITFPWAGQKDACRRIAETCTRTRAAFLELKRKYVVKNILTQAEADAIPFKIKLEIVDARPSGSRPLPEFKCPDCPEK
jgi:hypothetical protein